MHGDPRDLDTYNDGWAEREEDLAAAYAEEAALTPTPTEPTQAAVTLAEMIEAVERARRGRDSVAIYEYPDDDAKLRAAAATLRDVEALRKDAEAVVPPLRDRVLTGPVKDDMLVLALSVLSRLRRLSERAGTPA